MKLNAAPPLENTATAGHGGGGPEGLGQSPRRWGPRGARAVMHSALDFGSGQGCRVPARAPHAPLPLLLPAPPRLCAGRISLKKLTQILKSKKNENITDGEGSHGVRGKSPAPDTHELTPRETFTRVSCVCM